MYDGLKNRCRPRVQVAKITPTLRFLPEGPDHSLQGRFAGTDSDNLLEHPVTGQRSNQLNYVVPNHGINNLA